MPDRPATWDDLVTHEAQKAKVPPKLALALMQQESGGKPDATSEVGAHGLFQLMPATAQEMGVTDPADPVQNIRGGVGYLRKQLDASKGDVGMALARYHGGPDPAQHGPKTAAYVQGILGRLQAPGPAGAAELGEKGGVNEQKAGGGRFVSTALASQIPPYVGQPPPKPPNPQGFEPRPAMTGGFEGSNFDPKVQEWEKQHREATGGVEPPSGFLDRLKQGVDPRTPEGRRNIAGGVGALAGAALTRTPMGTRAGTAIGEAVPSIVSRIATAAPRVMASALGAFGGGATEEAGEQLVGSAPPSPTAVLKAGGQQAAYDVAGAATLWPIRAVGRRVVASRVSKYAAKGLTEKRGQVVEALQQGLESAQTLARRVRASTGEALSSAKTAVLGDTRAARGEVAGAIRGAREAGRAGVQSAAAEGRAGVEAATQAGRVGVESAQSRDLARRTSAEASAAAGKALPEAQYSTAVGVPPPAAGVGRQVQRVIEGPAATARDLAGSAVEEAAKSGPAVNIGKLKTEAARILEHELRPSAVAFPREPVAGAGEAAAAATGLSPDVTARVMAAGGPSAQAMQEAIAAAQGEAEKDVLKHPALGVINRILNAEDEVPFAAAHQFKRELDEAVGTAWDRTVQKRVTNITKTLRGTLRESLSGHAPYNAATAHYAQIAPLYTKEYAAQLRKVATTDPESLIRMINPNKPTALHMLRELLTTQATEGGGGAEGQQAFDAVRSAWTAKKVLSGPIDTLGTRLSSLDPDFVRTFYGSDPAGQQVLANLRAIDTAWQQAVTRGGEQVAAAKTVGEAGVKTARGAEQLGIESAQSAARAGTSAAQAESRSGVEAARARGQSYLSGVQQAGEQRVAGVRQAGTAARDTAAEDLLTARQAKRAGKKPSPEELLYAASSVARAPDVEKVVGDMLRAGLLPQGSIWGGISTARLMLEGPWSSDLLQWAAYSPKNTQRFVSAVTSPMPGTALADLIRLTGVGEALMPARGEVGAPPPKPPTANAPLRAGIGAPPPR